MTYPEFPHQDPLEPSTGELALEDRSALRRVAGLSTELADISEVEYRQLRLERVVLVGVWTEGSAADTEASMAELAALAETAGSQVLEGIIQRRDRPDPSTYIGSGKAAELREIVVATGADTVICDGELSPAQLTALEKAVKVKVIDRTALILDIFAQHATSREGKAQVSLAQMEYMLPRLRGWGESMSRQAGGRAGGSGGGVGLRGPGETKIETDRRRIRERMAKLRREIKDMKQARDTRRSRRVHSDLPSIAIVGYTNAGKSSLLNALTGAGCWCRTRCSRRWNPPPGARSSTTARAGRAVSCSPTPSASSGIYPPSWWKRSAPPWKRSSTRICWCMSSTALTRTRWPRSTRCVR
ncbi:GTP-binding protein HflX [Mycobacterium kansasii]|uniref:GTP-binding protein HflX n=1 Tax=Mycobacterium kansasii TaxID=1768 RepID=A0A1V3XZE2_MYCKA|nr:GTP-binding protein HflX [Mycobacterium kansasii]